MPLREENPLIDSDLELIINAFEQAMIQSQDIDSVFVPFRREMAALANYPRSVVESIDSVPLPSQSQEGNTGSPNQNAPAATSTPETATGNALNPLEDGDDEEEWTEKAKDWVSDCVPCFGEFERTFSAMDADFFKDLGAEWDKTLNEVWDKLTDFEDFLTGSEEDILSAFCDLGDALKDQCGPDLKKMIFILSMMLNRMQREFSLDLGILDSFLMAALSPIFNQLASMLENIVDLALDPIRCVLDYIQWQINNAPQLASQARGAIIDPIRQQAYDARARMNVARRANAQAELDLSTGRSESRSEAELAAERARLEELRRQNDQRSRQQMKSALARANSAFDRTRDALSYLDRFREYLVQGTDYLEDKKDWLLNLIEEFVNGGLDRWNDNMNFARGKTDLLTMISILKAMFEAHKTGDISCGPESDGMTSEDVQRITRRWQHPSESLEITVEDGNIVTRRVPDAPSTDETADRGVITGVDGPDSTDSTGTGTGSDGILTNVVARRPIASCLKKVTTDEADQVNHWIRQLEQEV